MPCAHWGRTMRVCNFSYLEGCKPQLQPSYKKIFDAIAAGQHPTMAKRDNGRVKYALNYDIAKNTVYFKRHDNLIIRLQTNATINALVFFIYEDNWYEDVTLINCLLLYMSCRLPMSTLYTLNGGSLEIEKHPAFIKWNIDRFELTLINFGGRSEVLQCKCGNISYYGRQHNLMTSLAVSFDSLCCMPQPDIDSDTVADSRPKLRGRAFDALRALG